MDNKPGYYYEVTDEQIREHQSRSLLEILQWHYEMSIFLNSFQTIEEKENSKRIKAKNYFNEKHLALLNNFKP